MTTDWSRLEQTVKDYVSPGTMVIALYSRELSDRVTGECALSEIARTAMQVTGTI